MNNQPINISVGGDQVAFNYEPRDCALFLALGAALAEVQALELHLALLLGMAETGGGDSFDSALSGFLSKTV